MTDRGDYISTYGGNFYPLDPREDEIELTTVAHALSNLCRFGGHIYEFYSVAQHCVLCSMVAPKEFKLEALLHDASEAYLVDIPRPIKRMLPDYQAMEQNVERVIASKFGLPFPMSPIIKEIDTRMLITEAAALLNPENGEWWLADHYPKMYDISEIQIRPWDPKTSEDVFLKYYNEYTS